jgi:hypothetical protein
VIGAHHVVLNVKQSTRSGNTALELAANDAGALLPHVIDIPFEDR